VVQLDGSGSADPDGDALTFTWSILSAPVSSLATLSDLHAVKPTFVADVRGDYVVQLIVNDGLANSPPTTVTISTENSRTTADAGQDQTVAVGATVQLDGSASFDPDGDTLTYDWSLTTLPSGSSASLSDSTAAKPTFVADQAGTYIAQLIVNDGFLASLPATS